MKEELIPLNSPLEHFTSIIRSTKLIIVLTWFLFLFVAYIVPDVGEVMLASFAANFSEDFISLRNPWYEIEKWNRGDYVKKKEGGREKRWGARSERREMVRISELIIIIISYCRWVGEKYDGVRCIWNSTQNTLYLFSSFISISTPYLFLFSSFYGLIFKMYTRRGLPINMLYCHRQLFIKSKTFLDGEIWYFNYLIYIIFL